MDIWSEKLFYGNASGELLNLIHEGIPQYTSSNEVFEYSYSHYNALVTFRERSGRVLDSRLRGHGFEPHRHHCVAFFSSKRQ